MWVDFVVHEAFFLYYEDFWIIILLYKEFLYADLVFKVQ